MYFLHLVLTFTPHYIIMEKVYWNSSVQMAISAGRIAYLQLVPGRKPGNEARKEMDSLETRFSSFLWCTKTRLPGVARRWKEVLPRAHPWLPCGPCRSASGGLGERRTSSASHL